MSNYILSETGQQVQAALEHAEVAYEQSANNASDIEALQALYQALQQSKPIPVSPSDTWPVANPSDGVIYRVVDRVNTPPQYYADYMWNGTAMVEMAQYNNAIDEAPTIGSHNLVESGGVASKISTAETTSFPQSAGAYTLTVGSAPALETPTPSGYKIAYVQDLIAGDRVITDAFRCTSSHKQVGYILNGLVVATEEWTSEVVSYDILCDGTFDAVIFQNAGSTAINARKLHPVWIEEQINAVNDRMDQLEQQLTTQIVTDYSLTKTGKRYAAATIGSAAPPSVESSSNYGYVAVEGIENGDKITIHVKSGASGKAVYKAKNGLITEIAVGGGVEYNGTMTCDGTFDALYISNYFSYVASPVVRKITTVDTIQHIEDEVDKIQREYNILCLGNSFTRDSVGYAPFLLEESDANIRVNIYIGFIGGSPIAEHLAAISGENVDCDGMTYTPQNYAVDIFLSGATAWTSVASMTADALLTAKKWDLITFQQVSTENYKSWDTYYQPFIVPLVAYLRKKVTHPFKLGYIATHAANSSSLTKLDQRFADIVGNMQKVISQTPVEVVIPYGTAIQNARHTYLDSFGAGSHMTYDGGHLNEGIPCLVANYVTAHVIASVVGGYGAELGSMLSPSAEWLVSKNIPQQHGTPLGLSLYNDYIAQLCAIAAVKNPEAITDIHGNGFVGTFPIELTLTNVRSDNPIESANAGDEWVTTLIADGGYTLSSVVVEMGGFDITGIAYDSVTGIVRIASVSGAVAITATAS